MFCSQFFTFVQKRPCENWILPQICMGMCLHQDITEEAKKAKLQSSKIEQDICDHARTEVNVVKILMLGKSKAFFRNLSGYTEVLTFWSEAFLWLVCVSGAAESGKTTLIKQIKIIHSQGFSKQELLSFKVLESCKAFVLHPGIISTVFESNHHMWSKSWPSFPPQPAVLDNLLTSIKFVLLGMGMLRINLANKKNKVRTGGTVLNSFL